MNESIFTYDKSGAIMEVARQAITRLPLRCVVVHFNDPPPNLTFSMHDPVLVLCETSVTIKGRDDARLSFDLADIGYLETMDGNTGCLETMDGGPVTYLAMSINGRDIALDLHYREGSR